MKIGTHTFLGYRFTINRSRERKWFRFPLCSLSSRGESPASCLWIIYLEVQVRKIGGHLQVPTCRATHFRKPRHTGSWVCQTPQTWTCRWKASPAKNSRASKGWWEVGSNLRAGKWAEWVTPLMWSGYSKPRKGEQAFPSPDKPDNWQQPLRVGNWVTEQETFRVTGEEIASLYCNISFTKINLVSVR